MCTVMRKIGTHSGKFHCDEVLACFLLKKLPEYVNSEIIRTRDQSVLDTCDVVVDVGGVYDPNTNRFDHHQAGFSATMNSLNNEKPWTIKLSSAGLVYYHFGERILRELLGPSHQSDEIISHLYDYIYENFIQEIDAIDNGVEMYNGEPKYRIHTNLSSRVANINPAWNSKEPYDSSKLFHSAMDFVGREFIDRVQYFIKSWWPARKIVVDAVENRMAVHSSGEIIELEQPCPWSAHLQAIEKEKDLVGVIKFVLFKDDNWRIMAVPLNPGSMQSRLFLLEQWRGLRNEELVKTSGIDGCVFVHAAGFIGGNNTREGAIAMAEKTLASQVIL
ncbi:UNVERIFIED_CONTAM: hypothetical protein PYX00_005871 [Menopon gallinae]|uniref:Uncharacterized protein n=1 Tax=Menopon gallinae TaxID=328185 RepID=A0AAW2HT81_9NEOP